MDTIGPCSSDETISINHVLPDDCLFHIFDYLNVKELIGIETVCKRWQMLSRRWWSRIKFCNFTRLSVKRSLKILSKCGNRLTRLNFPKGMEEIAEAEAFLRLVGDHYVNLQHLSLTLKWINIESPESFLNLLPKLKSLSIKRGEFSDAGRLKALIRRAKNLEKFVLFGHTDEVNEYFMDLTENCKHLECFDFDRRGKFRDGDLIQVFSRLKKLEVLKGNFFGNSALMHLNTTCSVLVLNCCGPPDGVNISEVLRRLVNLKVFQCGLGSWKFDLSALESSSNTLEELNLPYEPYEPYQNERVCPFFPNLRVLKLNSMECCTKSIDGMLNVLAIKCPNLENLDISGTLLSYRGGKQLVLFPKLRRLIMNNCVLMVHGWRSLISDSLKQLESFECRNVRFRGREGQFLSNRQNKKLKEWAENYKSITIESEQLLSDPANKCPDREYLDDSENTLSVHIAVKKLFLFPSLRRLAVTNCMYMDDACLGFIADNMKLLESFECLFVGFSDKELLRLLQECDKLTDLIVDIKNKEEFVKEATKIVRSRRKSNILDLRMLSDVTDGMEEENELYLTVVS